MAELNSGKYSISPNSGRLRKRVKKTSSEDKGLFKKRLDNFSFNSKIVFFVMLIIVGISLYYAYEKFQAEKIEAQQRYIPNPYKAYYDNLSRKKK
jgi:hypothetical protein